MSRSESKSIQGLTFVMALSLLLLSAAVVQAQEPASGACAWAQERCSADCFSLGDGVAAVSCLIGCDNAAVTCSDGEDRGKVTLSSEEYLAYRGDGIVAFAGACHPTTPCPTEYASCGSWSGYSDCGDPFCGIYRWCGDCGEPGFCFGDATRQSRERFRVCFNQQMEGCTEYERISTVVGCGC